MYIRKEDSAHTRKPVQVCGNYLCAFRSSMMCLSCLSVSEGGVLELAQTDDFDLQLCNRIS